MKLFKALLILGLLAHFTQADGKIKLYKKGTISKRFKKFKKGMKKYKKRKCKKKKDKTGGGGLSPNIINTPLPVPFDSNLYLLSGDFERVIIIDLFRITF